MIRLMGVVGKKLENFYSESRRAMPGGQRSRCECGMGNARDKFMNFVDSSWHDVYRCDPYVLLPRGTLRMKVDANDCLMPSKTKRLSLSSTEWFASAGSVASLAAMGVERVDPRVSGDAARSGTAAAAIPVSIQLRSQLARLRWRRRDVERRAPDRQIDNQRRDDFCYVHQGLWQESQQADHRRHAPKVGKADPTNADRAAGTTNQKTTHQYAVADENLMGVVKVEHLWSMGPVRRWCSRQVSQLTRPLSHCDNLKPHLICRKSC